MYSSNRLNILAFYTNSQLCGKKGCRQQRRQKKQGNNTVRQNFCGKTKLIVWGTTIATTINETKKTKQ